MDKQGTDRAEANGNATDLPAFNLQQACLTVSRPKPNDIDDKPDLDAPPPTEESDNSSPEKKTEEMNTTIGYEAAKPICDCITTIAAYISFILLNPQAGTIGIIFILATAASTMNGHGVFDGIAKIIAACLKGVAEKIRAEAEKILAEAEMVAARLKGEAELIVAHPKGEAEKIRAEAEKIRAKAEMIRAKAEASDKEAMDNMETPSVDVDID